MDREFGKDGSKLPGQLSDMTNEWSVPVFCLRKYRTRNTCHRCGTHRKPVLPNMGFNLYTLSVILTILLFSQLVIVESSPGAYRVAKSTYAEREDIMVVSEI